MNTLSLDYARIERAIQYLDQRAPAQPTLAELAHHVGLSESHFQKLFSRWAGISPKRFVQVQTLERAKSLLAESRPVLDVAWESGLSGGGRLHDLFVSLEAMTPGEYKAGGAGLEIRTGFHDTPFGECLIGVTERGVCHLAFTSGEGTAAREELRARWPNAAFRDEVRETRLHVDHVFGAIDGTPGLASGADTVDGLPRPLPLLVRGTNFQVKVWNALLRIPPGAVTTYEVVAAAIGAPSAIRAVGTAIGQNPVAWLIPCHRVIRKTGSLGGYRWGLPRKRSMLAWEAGGVMRQRLG